LFSIVLGDADWFELPWAITRCDVAGESWKAITIIDVTWIIAALAAS
jgi:hypothetical protein